VLVEVVDVETVKERGKEVVIFVSDVEAELLESEEMLVGVVDVEIGEERGKEVVIVVSGIETELLESKEEVVDVEIGVESFK